MHRLASDLNLPATTRRNVDKLSWPCMDMHALDSEVEIVIVV
jgi:hypothetical protein